MMHADTDGDPGHDEPRPVEPSTADPSAAQGAPRAEAGQAPQGDIHSYIGARLRQAFDDVAQQPVPDRFLQLMAELDTK